MTADEQLKMLLRISRKRRRDFAKMSPEEKRKAANEHFREIGLIDRQGRLTPPYR